MSEQNLRQLQHEMASHLRDPLNVAGPQDVERRRLKIYQDLIFNNIEGFISGAFPVLRELYSEEQWLNLMRKFVIQHESHSPYFLHISQEFLRFLENEYELGPNDPPFMLELAHYEWTELALDVSEEEEPANSDLLTMVDEALLDARPQLSPLAWPLSYQFPVHQIGPDFQPDTLPAENTFLVVYRQGEEVKFIQSNAVTVRLLLLLAEHDEKSLRDILLQLADEMQHPDPQQILTFALGLVRDLLSKNILY
ncbi:putative DNA-binding domain-containing protein [uncultured Pseudoteredinibacter sp.]|uniref:HvfC family RiPP maturation protein n=1 Tax=uncultured Pseudoteredinibacter sp. TaxID=1641701 RepID=UPI00260A5439|nr:putative DNA-binding domain-containing protein [uncultured Pseudoteredinibacter sp.]